jgi:hypothetical protein
VEVLEVQCVIAYLIACLPRELPFSHLEFEDDDRPREQKYRIDPAAHPRDGVLEQNGPGGDPGSDPDNRGSDFAQAHLQDLRLPPPCRDLGLLDAALGGETEFPDDSVYRTGKKSRNGISVP